MKIPIEIGKKTCRGCMYDDRCLPLKFKFNFTTLKIDCYWKENYYYANGVKSQECWHKNNKRHRDDGPAYIWNYYNGDIEYKWYYKNGIEMSEEEYYEKKT